MPSSINNINKLGSDFVVRAPEMTDIPALVALHNASSKDTLRTHRTHTAQYEALFKDEGAKLLSDMRVVTTQSGEIVAFQRLELEEPFISNVIHGAVHPSYRGMGIGASLVTWGEAQAREVVEKAPPDSRVTLKMVLFDSQHDGRTLATSMGFQKVREYIHLRIQLNAQPPPPTWPQGFHVKLIRPKDWPMVGDALGEAFHDHWGEMPLEETAVSSKFAIPPYDEPVSDIAALFKTNDPYWNTRELCFMALNEANEVVGSCLCNGKDVEFMGTGRLGSISVRRSYRGRGIGRALMLHAFGAFYQRGIRKIVTDTDGASLTGANFLYTSAGMRVYRREEDYEKVLREGKELRVMSAGDLIG
ncbi:MAG: GNAT family N-acetyltransferase [Chloroflexi bacterium]|nr:GNAT family N-acetyltransferase [Chloroflexota bacterium]